MVVAWPWEEGRLWRRAVNITLLEKGGVG